MGIEIERKFLVDKNILNELSDGIEVIQAYLPSSSHTSVRIRVTNNKKAFLSIKGKNTGAIRAEYEYPIPAHEAREIIDTLCEKPPIEKTRYELKYKGHIWEIDVFEGENKGLIIAEIELEAENEIFARPDWLGDEVTFDKRYYNVNLVKTPFKNWS